MKKIGLLILVFLLTFSSLNVIRGTDIQSRFDLKIFITVNATKMPSGFIDMYIPQNTTMLINQQSRVLKIKGVFDSSPADYKLNRDEDGNVYIAWSGNGTKVEIEIEVEIESSVTPVTNISLDMAGSFSDIPKTLSNYLSPNDAWNVTPDIKKLAQSLMDPNNVLKTVLNYAEWIDEHILYPYNPPHLLAWNASQTLKKMVGDCDDRAILFIAMAHSVGIPAFLQIGGVYLKGYNDELEFEGGNIKYSFFNVGWHGWVVVYIPPWGWVPLDLTFFSGSKADIITVDKTQYLKITTDNLLNHIIGAAAYAKRIVVIANIFKTSYITPGEEWLKSVRENKIKFAEKDVLTYLQDNGWATTSTTTSATSTTTPTSSTLLHIEDERRKISSALIYIEVTLIIAMLALGLYRVGRGGRAAAT